MAPTEHDPDFEALLELLKTKRGFDFTGYKRASLRRRIGRRMQVLSIDGYAAYAQRLRDDPDEFAQLFNTVLINVTAFFRDDVPWRTLAEQVTTQLLPRKGANLPLRVWSAGCATGEEAYTLVMVLAEAMGIDQFRERVKIYATDVDDDALAYARHATYTAHQVKGVPPELLERYFEHDDGKYTFRKDLRRSVIFGRNDLIQDAPISRVDILVCRNTLMYFDAPTQERILTRFHFALNDGGILFLGRAETLLTRSGLFAPVELSRRIFTKVGRPTLRERMLSVERGDGDDPAPPARPGGRLREAAFDAGELAQLVVDRRGTLVAANLQARTLFDLPPSAIGRPLQDFELSYRPVELRSRIDQAYAEGRAVKASDVRWQGADERWYEVLVTPLGDAMEHFAGVSITFSDITGYRRLRRELEQSHADLESAYEELQSTNEELETTNEELQSTIEELETTNEELQSTNEELETMNEELQSTNEELQTINDELRRQGDELNALNDFLESVFASFHGGVVVIDPDMRVKVWNQRAEDLWGLRADEVVGTHFLNLDIGLPIDQLRAAIRASLQDGGTGTELIVEAVNRRGRTIRCQVSATPLHSPGDEASKGAILLMEDVSAGGGVPAARAVQAPSGSARRKRAPEGDGDGSAPEA